MNVRFAEACKDNHLSLEMIEDNIRRVSYLDGRTQAHIDCTCEKDIYIGVFFDGTNNNKYRDTPNFSHSNVARLYEAYPGTPAAQTALPPTQKDINDKVVKRKGKVFPDLPFKPSTIQNEDFPYYRKIYVPGVGTPMPDVGDTGEGMHKTGGLAMALFGQVRLDWALLQVVNQVHAAIFGEAISPSIDMSALYKKTSKPSAIDFNHPALTLLKFSSPDIRKAYNDLVGSLVSTLGVYSSAGFQALLDNYLDKLKKALKNRKHNRTLPLIRKIRLSVFGFSRGAAEARAWVNMVNDKFNETTFEGIPLQIDFLGIFDTVASVGIAQSTPPFEGHAAWADGAMMQIPENVKRCAHLVAALEVRGSFPLDSVCRGGALPKNCKEIVYPGVHSDVGGGYPPNDQGRAVGNGAAGDAKKVSQIPLAQMYREARMGGVPLAPASAMDNIRLLNFAIHKDLKADFNNYVAATRTATIPATNGIGEKDFARMFPTETQPREELFRIVRRHAGIQLRWRKQMLQQAGGISALPNIKVSSTKFQDIEDFRGAEEELKKEIKFLITTGTEKFKKVDDTLFDKIYSGLDTATTLTSAASFAGSIKASYLYPLLVIASWGVKGSVEDVMKDKQHQWDTWLSDEWHDKTPLPVAANQLFEHYVHDSRAWFKALMCSDTEALAADDEAWFSLGGFEQERDKRIGEAKLEVLRAQKSADPKKIKEAQQKLADAQMEGHPLLIGAREPYRMWGYLRHRKIYENGMIPVKLQTNYENYNKTIQQEEDERVRRQRRTDLTNQENSSYQKEIKSIKDNANEALRSGRVTAGREAEFRESTQAVLAQRKKAHEEAIQRIEEMTN